MRSLTLIAGIALAGCTQSSTKYPSLLPRPIEAQSLNEPVPSPAPSPAATPDAALDAKVAAIRSGAEDNGRRFATAAQDAEAKVAVARGVKEGSDAWLEAQIALSGLEALRAPSLDALQALEALAIERDAAGQSSYPPLDDAVARVEALATAQQQRIETLEKALGGN